MAITVKINERAGTKLKASCSVCRRITNHQILCDVAESGRLEDRHTDYWYAWDNEHQVIQCCGCDSIRFRKTHQDSEDYNYYDDGESYHPIKVEIFPSSHTERLPIKEDWHLPSNLRLIYQETLSALNHKTPVLAGIGIRAIVETVCKDRQAKGKDLFEKITNLVKDGVLTQAGADILQKLRTLGNQSAHEVKPHSQEQLALAMDVVDHLLQGVYILPELAKHGLPSGKVT